MAVAVQLKYLLKSEISCDVIFRIERVDIQNEETYSNTCAIL